MRDPGGVGYIAFPDGGFASMTYGMGDPWRAGHFEVHCEWGSLRRHWSQQEPVVEVQKHADPAPEMRKLEPGNWTARQMEAFCKAIAEGEPVPVPGAAGRRAVAVAEAAVKSYESGKVVAVE